MNIFRILFVSSFVSLTAISCAGPLSGGEAATAGVAKTTNGGLDWVLANTVVTGQDKKGKTQTSSQLQDTDVYKLVFEPGNSQRMYAATSTDGVYYSEDSAESWKQILSGVTVFDIIINPKNSEHLYAAGTAAGNGKVLESKDKGKSWAQVYNEVSKQNPVQAIGMNPANPNDIVIGLQSGNVIKSNDAGKSWTLLQNLSDPVRQISWTTGGLYILTDTRGLYVSSSGGTRFNNISEYLFNFNKNRSETSASDALPDVDVPQTSIRTFNTFAVSARDQRLIYMAADNGLYKTLDGGETWLYVKLPLKSTNISVSIAVVSLGANDSLVYAGAGNTVYKSLNSGESWQVQSIATNAAVQYILIDPGLSQIGYVGLNGLHK
jgi:photosystem II stability/assembly factor-like uncharacterized protein